MLKKKHIVEILSVAIIAFLLGTIVNVNLLTMAGKDEEDDGSPWSKVWTTISELQTKVETWEAKVNRTWQTLAVFNITENHGQTPVFSISSELWRVTYELWFWDGGGKSPWDLEVKTEDGYLIDSADVLHSWHNAMYLHRSQKQWYLEWDGMKLVWNYTTGASEYYVGFHAGDIHGNWALYLRIDSYS